MTLATRACGPLSAAPNVAASAKSQAKRGWRQRGEKIRSKSATPAGHKKVERRRPVGPRHNGDGGIRYGKRDNAENSHRLSHTKGSRRGLQRTEQGKAAIGGSLPGRQHQHRLPEDTTKQQRQHAGEKMAGRNGSRASSRSSSVSISREDLQLRSARPQRQSVPAPSLAQSPLRRKSQKRVELPAWNLRRYLLRLRCEPKSREARCDQRQRRRRRHLVLSGQKVQPRQGSESNEGDFGESGEWMLDEKSAAGGGAAADVGENASNLSVFAAWGKRIREERAERERERKR